MKWIRRIAGGALLLAGIWAGALYLGVALPETPRDRAIKIVSADTPLRIVLAGTSLTASYDWPERLEACTGRPVSVTRIARAGAASDWGAGQADTIIAARPDIVFIEFSVNDADLRHGISLRESAANHRRLIGALQGGLPEARIVLMTMSPAHGLRRLLRPRLPAYYRLYRDLSEQTETGLLDIYPRWLSIPRSAREQRDGLHPSRKAAARVILAALGPYLGLACGP